MATRFGEAARKGLGLHEKAAAAHAEMGSVLAQASRDLSEDFGVALTLGFEETQRATRPQSTLEMMQGIPAPQRKVDVLIAQASDGRVRQSRVLADVEFGSLGFPVQIRFANQWVTAANKAEFEQALMDLLASPETGSRLAEIGAHPRAVVQPAPNG